ncbi:hypothetical protein VTL71DRAFT_11154 [Oculimacula yallundae]|uniref:Heterokaryon incompatibility domain-containing protein n=1 Tax=Oculimacula yallundae TaxID=86028 RepID=A0ABR4CVM8_9HELO
MSVDTEKAKLCNKCKEVFSPPSMFQGLYGCGPVEASLLTIHSQSISLLQNSKNGDCQLCQLIWNAMAKCFRDVARLEKEDPTTPVMELHYRMCIDASMAYDSVIQFFLMEYPRAGDIDSLQLKSASSTMEIKGWPGPHEPSLFQAVYITFFAYETVAEPSVSSQYSLPKSASGSDPPTNSLRRPYERALGWLTGCRDTHSKCTAWKTSTKKLNPSRLLEITGVVGSPVVRLYCPKDTALLKYVALSHRWEVGDNFRLRKDNLTTFMHGIPVELLSATIQEAIRTCQHMGISHIWIDSLCIIQDSDEDWTHESSIMGDVYKHCYFCIASIAASDDIVNVRYEHDLSQVIVRKITLPTMGEEKTVVLSLSGVRSEGVNWNEVENSSLRMRGWVFQERALAPRTLYLGAYQMLWSCNDSFAAETLPVGLGEEKNIDTSLKSAIASATSDRDAKLWHWIVNAYSVTKLTFDSDRLIALAGVSQAFEHEARGQFLAGLWSNTLLIDLLWFTTKGAPAPRTESFVAPSWSWASLSSGTVIYFHYLSNLPSPCATIIEATTIPSAGDIYGQLSSGHIRIRGFLVPSVSDAWLEKSTVYLDIPADEMKDMYYFVLCECEWWETDRAPGIVEGSRSWIHRTRGLTWGVYGLMLVSTKQVRGEFLRCGSFAFSGADPDVNILKNQAREFSDTAVGSGIPYENVDGDNQFVVTIV